MPSHFVPGDMPSDTDERRPKGMDVRWHFAGRVLIGLDPMGIVLPV